MSDITFGELPGPAYRARNTRHADDAVELREHPGQWGHVSTHATRGSAASIAHLISKGALTAYAPEGTYEATSRTVNGEFRVYARYVGEVTT